MNAAHLPSAKPVRATRDSGCVVTPLRVELGYGVVSFDLDGTLVDTAGEIALAANRALESHGLTGRSQAEIKGLIGEGSRQLMLKLLARILLEQPSLADAVRPDEVLEAFDQQLARTPASAAAPYPGARQALERLRDAGVRLACVTNKELRHARRVLHAAHLDSLFALVIGGDSLPHKKPHASVLRHVVETLHGDTRRAAHVGDSRIDVEAARNAGVAAWAVPYGYNAGAPIADANPQRIFDSLGQVADHVLASRSASIGTMSPLPPTLRASERRPC
jgi:phosphoglycolate phosphatase